MITNCEDSPCVFGSCIGKENNFTCDCYFNFTGRYCDVGTIAICNIENGCISVASKKRNQICINLVYKIIIGKENFVNKKLF